MTKLTMAKALNAGLRRALEADPKVVLAGEDIGKLGGVFRVTEGLQKDFGEGRVIDSPLAESGIVGTAVGMALRGYRPVCEIQFDGFVYPAFDQIVSQVAKMRFRSAGRLSMPDPDPVSIFDHVYAEGSPEIDEQRAQFSAYLATFEGSAH